MRNIRGILISEWQIECFLERLAKRYQGWEIEDILNALINKDIGEFEDFVIGDLGSVGILEEEIQELKAKLNSIDAEYMETIREQESRLAALGHRNLIVENREELLKMLEDEEDGEEVNLLK